MYKTKALLAQMGLVTFYSRWGMDVDLLFCWVKAGPVVPYYQLKGALLCWDGVKLHLNLSII